MRIDKVVLPSNRKFGIFFTFIFLLCAVYFFYNNSFIFAYSLIGISAIFFLVAMLKPRLLFFLNKSWMKLGLLLGMVASPFIMGLVFFGIFTPAAVLMKLFRRDELRLRLGNKESHWVARNRIIDPTSFKRQF